MNLKLASSEVKTKFQKISMLIFKGRMVNTVQIINILNSSKNCVMKWSVHSKKGKFTREVVGTIKLSSHSLKIAQNINR